MPRYNLAYLPSDKVFAESCVAFASANFAGAADSYCLNGSDTLPHVTLCQFVTEEDHLESLWEKAGKLCPATCNIVFDFFDLRPGGGDNAGFVMAELVVRREPDLIACQQKFSRMLVSHDIEPLTQSGERYFPHLTLARLAKVPKVLPKWSDQSALRRPQPFHLTLGLSSDTGIYRKTIPPR